MGKTPVLFYREGACALGSLIALLWLDEPFWGCRLEGDAQDREEFLKLNALGEVPVLFMDGVVLTENAAILGHIGLRGVEKGLHFRPEDPRFDQLNRAIGFITSNLHEGFGPIFSAAAYHDDPTIQDQIREKVIQGSLRESIQHANDHLLKGVLLYDRPTVGDACLFEITQWMERLYDVESDFPNIHRFREAMMKDPIVRLALTIDRGERQQNQGAFQGHLPFESFIREAIARKTEVDSLTDDGARFPGLSGSPTDDRGGQARSVQA